MERLIAIWCPSLLEEREGNREAREFLAVLEVVERFCPWVEPVRLGICTLPARGPSRFFGGEELVTEKLAAAVAERTGSDDIGVGAAEGLFAAVLAARSGVIVSRDEVPSFLAPWSMAVLRRPELAVTLQRLGIHTLGQFAALSARHVLARFGSDAALCHRVARGEEGELVGLRDPGIGRRLRTLQGDVSDAPRQPGFFGGVLAADTRATRSIIRLQRRFGPDSVFVARLRGGRSPADRARLVPWGSLGAEEEEGLGRRTAPWPGRLPAPSPVTVLNEPIAVEVLDPDARPVLVSGRGLLSAEPALLSIGGGPWQSVEAWAGPWPSTERWWSGRRRRARLQVVTVSDLATLVVIEGERWWLEAVYD
jgi:hypothetical protein